jgi:carboxyl-terminal processing protease
MLRKLFGCFVALGMSLCTAQLVPERMAIAIDTIAPALQDELLAEGLRLESDRRWQEAIQIYEKIVRKSPLNIEIERRLQIVRVHYDVSRRYADRSFVASVERVQPTVALDLLSEILTKLQLYYVEPLDFGRLLQNGTAFLEVALTDPEFCRQNVSSKVSPEKLEHFRLNIHKSLVGLPATSVQDVRNTVSLIAKSANEQVGLPVTAVISEYMAGFVGLLDPYSAYLTGSEYREIMSQIEGNLIGIGVELWADGDVLRIVEVFKGAPSQDAGLVKGDVLVEIGGVRVTDIGAKRAADLLRGPEGSSVKIVYDRGQGVVKECTIKRRRVEVPSVNSVSIKDPVNGIAYLRISNFQRTTTNEVDEALRALYNQGMKSLIIDLRRNPGGLLDAAVEIADRFLPSGAIVSTRGRNGQENRSYSAKMPGTWEMPLMVMIDEDSASASEIFAGAIRDHGRGLIVGRTSYGKGSVQGVFQNELTEGGIRLTISKFFSPAGHAISARGITPHYVFDNSTDSNANGFQTVGKPVFQNPNVNSTAASSKAKTVSQNGAFGSEDSSSTNSAKPNVGNDNASSEADDLLRAIELAKSEFPKLARLR